MPSEVRTMTLPQAMNLFRYWEKNPPEHEAIAIALRCYTTWGQEPERPPTPAELQKSLQERWKAGAMNPKELFEMFGDKPVEAAIRAPTMH